MLFALQNKERSNMKKLIIAEKPSLAQAVRDSLVKHGEFFYAKGEYYESQNYLVSSVFGHVYGLCDIEDYIETGGWKLDYLPFVPKEYKFKPDKDALKRIRALKELCASDEVEGILHCGDADREGQIIVDILLSEVHSKKPVYRMWFNDQTEDELYRSICEAKPNSEYKGIHDAGMTRLIRDWDYGINLTRYATVKTNAGKVIRIGRVKGAITKAVFDREEQIKNFVPRPYLRLESKEETNGTDIKLMGREEYPLQEREAAENYAAELNSQGAYVTKIEQKEKVVSPPKLFSQTSLQNYMSNKFSFSPDKTLKLAQSLYEKKLTTYPRTNTEYLTDNEKETVKEVIRAHDDAWGCLAFRDTKRVFNSAKVDAHSAIIPTAKTLEGQGVTLTDDEALCYNAILKRFMENFYNSDCRVMVTEMYINCGLEEFKIKGEVEIQRGFRNIEETRKPDEEIVELPNLKEGDRVNVCFKPVEKETQPPKHFTVESLNSYLQNPFKADIKESDDEYYKKLLSGLEIGTDATRAPMIKALVSGEYISLKKNTYGILPLGEYMVKTMDALGIDMSPEQTAKMGQLCKEVAGGKLSAKEVIEEGHKDIALIIGKNASIEALAPAGGFNDVLCKCPKCGSDVVENKAAYSCKNRDCSVAIFKSDKYFNAIGKKMTRSIATELISRGKANVKGIKGKYGNYNATIVVDFSGKYPRYEMERRK